MFQLCLIIVLDVPLETLYGAVGNNNDEDGDIDEEDEEDDDDEGEMDAGDEDDDDDFKKKVMVGPTFQASIPVGLSMYGDVLPYENEDKLIWEPSQVNENEVEEYLQKVRDIKANLDDQEDDDDDEEEEDDVEDLESSETSEENNSRKALTMVNGTVEELKNTASVTGSSVAGNVGTLSGGTHNSRSLGSKTNLSLRKKGKTAQKTSPINKKTSEDKPSTINENINGGVVRDNEQVECYLIYLHFN